MLDKKCRFAGYISKIDEEAMCKFQFACSFLLYTLLLYCIKYTVCILYSPFFLTNFSLKFEHIFTIVTDNCFKPTIISKIIPQRIF